MKFRFIEKQIGSIEILEKQHLVFEKKLLKALNIMNKMHEYEIKCFSKTQVLIIFRPFKTQLN